jgi:glycosyltransferase involved in cell wall biosynthesis
MRLALVSQEFPPETACGGIGTQNYSKAHGLAALGHEVHVIAQSKDEWRRESRDGLVHIVRIPGPDWQFPVATEEARWIAYSASVAAAIARLHARFGLDLVEFADWGSEGFVHLLNQCAWNRIPSVIHLHGPIVMFAHAIGWPEPGSEFYRIASMMEQTCLRRADAVFSSSRCSVQWVERFHGLDSRRIPVIHSGVDTQVFRPLDVAKEERPTVIFVGKIERNKGVELLVEAACRLADQIPNLRLRLVGRENAELTALLQRRSRQTCGRDLLEVIGFVDHASLPQLLSRAHVFAAPSKYEGGPGFVYLEAMACGVPVVACSGSGASEVVVHGENGLLVPPDDVQELFEALRRLLNDPFYREKMGGRARRYVLENADSQQCFGKLDEFYRRVVSREPRTVESVP